MKSPEARRCASLYTIGVPILHHFLNPRISGLSVVRFILGLGERSRDLDLFDFSVNLVSLVYVL